MVARATSAAFPKWGGALTGPVALNFDISPGSTFNTGMVFCAATPQSGNRSIIETNILLKTQDAAVQGAVPLQVNEWNSLDDSVEPIVFFRSRGASIGSAAIVQKGDGLGLIQFEGDDGTGAGPNNPAVNLTAKVSSLSNPAAGIVPGLFQISTTNSSGTMTPAVIIDSDQSVALLAAVTIKGVVSLQTAGAVLPEVLNTTLPGTNSMTVGSLLFNGFSSASVKRTYGSIFVQTVSVTDGAETSNIRLRVRQGGTLTDALTLTGGASTIAASMPNDLTIASTVAIPAGGTAGVGLKFSTTANFGVFFGSGAPSRTAAKGSIYLRSDGSGTSDRLYVNTDGSNTWTAVTTAA